MAEQSKRAPNTQLSTILSWRKHIVPILQFYDNLILGCDQVSKSFLGLGPVRGNQLSYRPSRQSGTMVMSFISSSG